MADRTLHAKHSPPLFRELFPAAPVHELDGAGHYSLEDAPGAISALVRAYLRRT